MGQVLSTRETVWEQHQLPPRRTNFGFLVRDALRHLYDLSYLQTHPLGQLLRREPGVPVSRMDRMLQQRLQEAVEWLRPHTETSVTRIECPLVYGSFASRASANALTAPR